MIGNFFVSSSLVINRTPTVDASKVSNDVAVSRGQCKTCHQCNVTCNK